MPGPSPVSEFVERAKASGTPDESIVGILTARGWPEKEVYEALAVHYETAAGVSIPRRAGAGAAARDAFFYLVIFSTLATWTIAFGSVAFSLIDQWFSDSLFNNTYSNYDVYSVANSLACIIIAFPIYLLVSRSVLRQTRLRPEMLNSPVRKWLTYMALVIAAGVFIGDLITALTYFLRGEVSWRAIADGIVVLVLSGGVFFYYFGGLKKSEESGSASKSGRDAVMALASAVTVVVIVALGFWHTGGPGKQRMRRADDKRLQDLYALAVSVHTRWSSKPSPTLPAHLDELPGAVAADPITRQAYEYHPGDSGGEYQLCAAFSLPSSENQAESQPGVWTHPAGHYCFHLNATGDLNSPNAYLYP